MSYAVVDYDTGDRLTPDSFETWDEAFKFISEYLQRMRKEKVIHNNLFVIEKEICI